MELTDFRRELDDIDAELVEVFLRRMDVSTRIARFKAQNARPIYDREREIEKLAQVCALAGAEYAEYAKLLYLRVLELSRARQHELIGQ